MTNKDVRDQDADFEKRHQLGSFFRKHRQVAGLSEAEVASELELSDASVLSSYEQGAIAIPLEDVYALTNLLNVAPEDVMALVGGLYTLGTD